MGRRLYRVLCILLLLGPVALARVESPPRSPADAVRDIRKLLERHDLAAAEQRAREALKRFPNDAALCDLWGVVEAQKGNYGAAESGFLEAIKREPVLSGAYLNLGHLYQQEGTSREATAKALEIYARLLRFDSGNVEANYQSAILLEHREDFQASLAHLARLPAADQGTAQALSVRCGDLAGLGARDQARTAADRLLQSPDLAEADVLSVLPLLESSGSDDVAARLLDGAVQRRLAGFATWEALGRLYEKQGRLNDAIAALESAAQVRPRSVETLTELARIADREHDEKRALGYLAHARDLDPRNPAIHFLFGVVSMKEDLLEEAYKSLKQAVSLAPDNPAYNYGLGVVAEQRADPGEAIPFLKKYCALRPHDPRGRLQLGMAYFESHHESEAQRELEDAARFGATAAAAHFFLGRIANQQGDYSRALDELHQALAIEPHYADPYAEEGIVYMKLKKDQAAETAFRQALAIQPDHYAANLNLMMLYQRTGDARAAGQAARFDEVRKKRAENAKLALRSIEIIR